MAENNGSVWGNIALVGRVNTGNLGQFRMSASGFSWRSGGSASRAVDIAKGDIEDVTVMRIPGTHQLAVHDKTGKYFRFNGFREADVGQIKEFVKAQFATDVKQRDMAVSGRNWGKAEVDGANLSFSVNGKTAFEVDCRDIGGVQQAAKTDVLVEFAMDDTATDERDALFEMSFHIPLTSTDFPPPAKPAKAAAAEGADGADGGADEEAPAPAKVLIDRLMEHAAASTGDPIATFHDVGVLTPRGNFTVEMHATFLRLTGQAADFKIQYSNLTRLFVLPRPNSPNMYAILTLDSAIRKGQTFYPHIVMQFRTDSQVDLDTNAPAGFKPKTGTELKQKYEGNEVDIFYQVLKALANIKVARQGTFRSAQGGQGESGSAAVRCVLRSDDGHLFCLNKVFFFLPKPPTLIRYDEVEQIEFERQTGKATKTFDLAITLKNAPTTAAATLRFTNIAQQELQPLATFFAERQIQVVSLQQAERKSHLDLGSEDEEEDYVTKKMRAEGMEVGDSDDEDEDFKGGSEDESSSGSSSSSEGGSGDEGEGKKEKKKEKKAKGTPKKRKVAEGGEGVKKKRQKKDKNAPKRGLSAFMFFSQAERSKVLADNPGIAFKDIGKQLGERWKALSKEDKEPYEAQAKEDKERYQRESKEYEKKKREAAYGAAGSDDDKKSGGGSGAESDGGADNNDD